VDLSLVAVQLVNVVVVKDIVELLLLIVPPLRVVNLNMVIVNVVKVLVIVLLVNVAVVKDIAEPQLPIALLLKVVNLSTVKNVQISYKGKIIIQ